MSQAILPVHLERFAYGRSNAGVGFAQHIPVVLDIRHEPSSFDANPWLEIQTTDDRRDVQVVCLGEVSWA